MKTLRISLSFAAAAALLLGGCGGGSLPHTAPASTGPAPAKSGTAQVDFVVRVPSASHAAARRPAYISPATKSMSLTIAPPGGATPITAAIGLVPGVAGCTQSDQGTVCTYQLSLAPASAPYVLTLVAYDGPALRGSVSGNPVSAAQNVPFTVVAHKQNTVALTLDGVPALLTLAPTGAAAAAVGGSQTSGFTFATRATQTFSVVAHDADGYVLAGPGAPSFQVSASGSYTVGQPTAQSPNTFTITPPASGAIPSGTLTVTASSLGCTVSGSACTQTFGLAHAPILAIANTSPDSVTLFALPYAGQPPFQTITSAIAAPSAVAADAAGDLAVSNANNTVSVYPAGNYGTASPTIISSGVSAPNAVLFDAAGDLFVGNGGNGSVTEYPSGNFGTASPAAVTPAVTDPGVPAAFSLALDSSGNLYVASEQGFSVTQYPGANLGASPQSLASCNGLVAPTGMAVGANGNVYVANNLSSTVTIFGAPPWSCSSSTVASITPEWLASPLGIAVDTRSDVAVIDHVNTTYSVDIFGTSNSYAFPQSSISVNGSVSGIAYDSAGQIYVAIVGSTGSAVAIFAPGATRPVVITSGLGTVAGTPVIIP